MSTPFTGQLDADAAILLPMHAPSPLSCPNHHLNRCTPQVIREKNICLYNCKHHSSQAALRAALWINNHWIISRDQVKQYKYCKVCLIELAPRQR